MSRRRALQSTVSGSRSVPYFSSSNYTARTAIQASKNAPSSMLSRRFRSTWYDRQQQNAYRDDYSSKQTILYGLIGINTAVFAGWLLSGESFRSRGSRTTSGLSRFMRENFLLSPLHVAAKKYWTILTCNISHIDPFHYLANMVGMYAFGSVLVMHPVIRTGRFLTIIFGSALASSAADIWHRAQTRKMGFSLGASGVNMGLGAVAACIAPRLPFLLFGVVPVPLWVLVPGYFAFDLLYLDNGNSHIGHAAHLGGGAFGILFYLLALRRRRF